MDNKNKDLSQLFRMLGIAMILPMALLSGPLIGYFLSQWLIRTWHLSPNLTLVLVLIGFAGSVLQTIKLLKQLYQGNYKKNL